MLSIVSHGGQTTRLGPLVPCASTHRLYLCSSRGT